jgi:hypothetical protein
VEAMMLFGMGMQMSDEEDEKLKPIIQPCYAALGLANDYFSFDREYAEFTASNAETLTNAVWLHMKWHGVDVEAAKDMVRSATYEYEKTFLERVEEFKRTQAPISQKLDRYLRALSYQVSGNVVWSLNCPRYHPEFRYDPNGCLENFLTARHLPTSGRGDLGDELLQDTGDSRRSSSSDSITTFSTGNESSVEDDASTASSMSSRSCHSSQKPSESFHIPEAKHLSAKVSLYFLSDPHCG